MGMGTLYNKRNKFIYHVEVFWVVIPYSDVVRYQRFGGKFYLHLQGTTTQRGVTTRKTVSLIFIAVVTSYSVNISFHIILRLLNETNNLLPIKNFKIKSVRDPATM